jgi:hypothetical protein
VTRVLGVGLLTGWGAGVGALPEDARRAACNRRVIAMPTPVLSGERFRRATRECLLAVAAVEAALRDADLDRSAVAGSRTALVYVTAAAYGASNKDFIVTGAAYFPYTAPSAVPPVWMRCGRPARYSPTAAPNERWCSQWKRSKNALISGRVGAGPCRGRSWRRRPAPS